MPRPPKRRVPASRVTAKGTRPENYKPDLASHTGFAGQPQSPIWIPILLFSLLGLGVMTIIVNYLGVLWDTSNVVLLGGLGLILAGIVTATQYR